MSTILAALAMLNVTDDAHWTTDGLPRIDTVKDLSGDQSVTREAINQAAPGFSRANPTLPGAQAEQAGAGGTATTAAPIVAPAAPAPAQQPDNGGTNGEVQQEEVAGAAESGPVSERSALEAELAAAQDQLAEIEQAFVRAEVIRREARAKIDRIVVALDKLPKEPSTAPFLGYLAAQARELEQRAAQRNKLRESNVDLKDLAAITGGAAIDNAMARKRSFGAMRPNYFGQEQK